MTQVPLTELGTPGETLSYTITGLTNGHLYNVIICQTDPSSIQYSSNTLDNVPAGVPALLTNLIVVAVPPGVNPLQLKSRKSKSAHVLNAANPTDWTIALTVKYGINNGSEISGIQVFVADTTNPDGIVSIYFASTSTNPLGPQPGDVETFIIEPIPGLMLTEGKTYGVAATAVNSIGESPLSISTSLDLTSAPPAPVINYANSGVTHAAVINSIIGTFTERLTGLQTEYAASSDGGLTFGSWVNGASLSVPPSSPYALSNQVVSSNLTDGLVYKVRVLASNIYGDTPSNVITLVPSTLPSLISEQSQLQIVQGVSLNAVFTLKYPIPNSIPTLNNLFFDNQPSFVNVDFYSLEGISFATKINTDPVVASYKVASQPSPSIPGQIVLQALFPFNAVVGTTYRAVLTPRAQVPSPYNTFWYNLPIDGLIAGTIVSFDNSIPLPPNVPNPPTFDSPQCIPGDGSLQWLFLPPVNNGGSPITKFHARLSLNGTPITDYPNVAASATSLNTTGLTNGGSYSLQIAAVNSVGESSYATSNPFVPALAVGAPTSFVAQPLIGGTSVLLTWAMPLPSSFTITGYKVYQLVNGVWTLRATLASSTFQYTALSAGPTPIVLGTPVLFAVQAIAGPSVSQYNVLSVVPANAPSFRGEAIQNGNVFHFEMNDNFSSVPYFVPTDDRLFAVVLPSPDAPGNTNPFIGNILTQSTPGNGQWIEYNVSLSFTPSNPLLFLLYASNGVGGTALNRLVPA